ncbi:CDP-archaeol synthase [Edaphobacter bradus]|uniref:CDP-archaeol synthase n=1 Tax=Edaphobacter bradus TaxID=2259016 RepID=UPI0021E07F7F|nr:CDP-archaeol synthase [Edaphobacter bradus]
MHTRIIIDLLALLVLANGTPVIINRLMGTRLLYPIDGGLTLADGQPLFGPSKTLRGLFFSLLVTATGALLLGMGWRLGVVIGAIAMGGDLFSSFCKRRLRLVAGSRATGLDQIPESLFPILACRPALSLTVLDIGVTVAIFLVGEMILSVLFFKLRLRERPY